MKFTIALLLVLFSSTILIHAQTNNEYIIPPSNSEVSKYQLKGLLFGDAYYIPKHHLSENGSTFSGAVLRRAYLTFDMQWNEQWKSRIRMELNQSGQFENYDMEANLKDLYVSYLFNKHEFTIGLSPSLTFDLVEQHWGKRYLVRTPMDLQGIASREFGITAKGPLNQSGNLKYRAMVSHNKIEFSNVNEIGKGTKWMMGISYQPHPNWFFDAYGDFEKLKGPHNRTTLQCFAEYSKNGFKGAFLYSYQDREDDPALELASVYAIVPLLNKTTFITRVDRVIQPSPKGDNISYIPFDPSACATLFVNGVEFCLKDWLYLTPNVLFTDYQKLDKNTPSNDLYYRLTLFVNFE